MPSITIAVCLAACAMSLSTANAQCANGVCRIVQAPARAVARIVPPRRSPVVWIETREISAELGPSAEPLTPPAAPASCQCDNCTCVNCACGEPVQQVRVVRQRVYTGPPVYQRVEPPRFFRGFLLSRGACALGGCR